MSDSQAQEIQQGRREMGITDSGPAGQAKGQEVCVQAKEARAGNLERV